MIKRGSIPYWHDDCSVTPVSPVKGNRRSGSFADPKRLFDTGSKFVKGGKIETAQNIKGEIFRRDLRTALFAVFIFCTRCVCSRRYSDAERRAEKNVPADGRAPEKD